MKKRITLAMMALLPVFCLGQETYVKVKQVAPHAPDIAALGKFGDIPVGNFTGTASISIPIYTLKIKDFALPISVAYHTGGIKVEEQASNIGLGWALSAGGTISISQNGLPDFGPNGFCSVLGDVQKQLPATVGDFIFDTNYADGGNRYAFAKNVAEGMADSQPDFYSYNFGGYSGKFYFDQYRQVHTIPFSNLKFDYAINTGYFTITDEKGVKYFFEKTASSAMPNNCGADILSRSLQLSKIVLTDNNVIDFNYDYIEYDTKIQPYRVREIPLPGNATRHFTECNNSMVTTNHIKEARLSSIVSSTGVRVLFNYGSIDREDQPGTKSLTGIQINSVSGPVDSFTFMQSYWRSNQYNAAVPKAEDSRLRLDQVVHQDGAWKFEYENGIALPNRLSFAQDHWGYYNGKSTNASLLPAEPQYGFMDGADREVGAAFTPMAILKKVTYPTGGSTAFEYEPNRYAFSGQVENIVDREYNLYSIADGTASKEFTVTSMPADLPGVYVRYDAGPEMDQPCNITLTGPNGYLRIFGSPGNGAQLPNLAPGTYTMNISTTGSYPGGYLSISFKEKLVQVVDQDKLVGGLRVKRMVDFDGQSNKITRFLYTDPQSGKSSGNINFKPVYTRKHSRSFLNAEWMRYDIEDYWRQTASSVYPMGSVQGGAVGYTTVQVLHGDNGENGKTEYSYSFFGDRGGSESQPEVPIVSYDWASGRLLGEKIYKVNTAGTSELVRETSNFYSIRDDSEYWNYHFTAQSKPSDNYYKGWGLSIIYKKPEYSNGLIKFPAEFSWNDFKYVSEWQHLDSTLVKEYSAPGKFLRTKKDYQSSPANLLVTKENLTNSKKEKNTTEIRYAQNMTGLSGDAEAARTTLINKHNWSAVLEKNRYKNDVFLDRERVNYRNWDSAITEPMNVESQSAGQNPEERIRFYGYDAQGNLLSQSMVNGAKSCFIWSYGGQYAIAKIDNVDYATVQGVLTAAGLSNFSAQENPSDAAIDAFLLPLKSLPGIMLSTYRYRPLVGLSSQTDPKGMTTSYDYDQYGRLRFIKDQDGNIVKANDYHYKP